MVMTRSVKRPARAVAPEAFASVTAAWAHLRACLEDQSAALSAEVRTYPTPIAACDEQLTEGAIDDERELALRARLKEAIDRLPR